MKRNLPGSVYAAGPGVNRPMSAQFVLSSMRDGGVSVTLIFACQTRQTRQAGPGVMKFAGVCRAFWSRAAADGFGVFFLEPVRPVRPVRRVEKAPIPRPSPVAKIRPQGKGATMSNR